MMFRYSKVIPGILAVGIYILLVGLLLVYFNTRSEEKAKHYVKKDEHRIQVAFSQPQKKKKEKPKHAKPKKKVKKQVKKAKKKPKPQAKPKKSTKKKVIKEKVVKKPLKKKEHNITKKPKNKPRNLFENLNVPKKKSVIQVSDKPIKTVPKHQLIQTSEKPVSATERINNSLKNRKASQSGVESAYLAKVQSMLEGWPAQSEYAGEKVKIILYIDTNGFFEFKLKVPSANENFNRGITEYLEELQNIGFGPHNGGRTYKFEAEFIAKE